MHISIIAKDECTKHTATKLMSASQRRSTKIRYTYIGITEEDECTQGTDLRICAIGPILILRVRACWIVCDVGFSNGYGSFGTILH